MAEQPPFGRLWPEPWASQVAVRAGAVQGQLDQALAPEPSSAQNVARWHVERMLDGARAATERGPLRWQGPLDRWRGTSVKRGHYCLHVAKTALVDVLDEHKLDARIPAALARLSDCLPAGDPRRQQVEALAQGCAVGLEEKRAQLKQALEVGYDAADQLHSRLRAFRNLLISVGAVILLFMAILIGVVWSSPSSVPFCFTPAVTALPATAAAATSSAARVVCPSGEDPVRGPFQQALSAPDIAIVAGLGTVGGALAAAFAIRNLRGTSTPPDRATRT